MSIEQSCELKIARENRGWSQKMLGCYLEISQQYINKMENGDKPLNLKALRFIEEQNRVENEQKGEKTHSRTCIPSKSSQKGVKNVLETNKLKAWENPKKANQRLLQTQEEIALFERWWEEYHPMCLKCELDCKQSLKVEIVTCPQFKKKK